MMMPHPLIFRPILKEKVWGGRHLAELGKDLPPETPIGESWELADLPETVEGGRSIIANGPLAGRTLRQAIAADRVSIMGAARLTPEGGFPLLVKFLDAREHLSVQVHPSPDYARRHSEAHLKSEAWVVVRAEPGAVIYKGVKPQVTRETFAEHLRSGGVAEDLVAVEVRPGDCHYLPSGTCHALGAGILVAEIQSPSDTTFRVYDWGRTNRQLHIDEALQCIAFGEPPRPAETPGVPVDVDGLRTTPLAKTDLFGLERIEALAVARHRIETQGQPEVWMVLAGVGRIETRGAESLDVAAGTTVLLPAAIGDAEAHLDPGATILRVTLPSPIEGLIA